MDSALLKITCTKFSNVPARQDSGSILQTALCYIQAVRHKVPEILCDKRLGVRAYIFCPSPRSSSQPKLLDRKLSNSEGSDTLTSDELLKTVRLIDKDTDDVCDTSSLTKLLHMVLPSRKLERERRALERPQPSEFFIYFVNIVVSYDFIAVDAFLNH